MWTPMFLMKVPSMLLLGSHMEHPEVAPRELRQKAPREFLGELLRSS